jgi:hypothetical protein
MKKRCAVFTTVKNESIFLPIWLRHYQQYFANEDIYILDHQSTDGSTLNLPVNVRLVSNDYVGDHEWMAKIASDFQKELLKEYECVIFAEGDEIIYSPEKSFDKAIDEFIQSDDLYATCSGYSVIQDIQNEPPLCHGDCIFEKRNFWYKDPLEDKTLISKVPLEWTWGFHRLKGRNNNYSTTFYLAHFHRLDYETMVKRHKVRTSFQQKNDGGGHHWKSNEEEIYKVFVEVASQPIAIPEQHKVALQHLTY